MHRHVRLRDNVQAETCGSGVHGRTPRGCPRPGISIRTCGSDVQVRNTSGGAAGSEFDVQPRVRHVRALNWKMYVLVTCME